MKLELEYWEKAEIIESLEASIKEKEYLKTRGILVQNMEKDIKEIEGLISKIKKSM